MKKTLLIGLLAIFAGIHSAFGQGEHSFEAGAQGSLAASKFHGNMFLNRMHKPAWCFGRSLYFQYNTNGPFSVRVEPGLEQKGSRLDMVFTDQNGNQTGTGTTVMKLDYYTLQLLFRATFGQKVQYYINAGPYIGYLSGISRSTSSSGFSPPRNPDDFNSYKDMDAGVTVGAGLIIPIDEHIGFSVEVRDNLGLYDISRVPAINGGTVQTNAICLVLGLGYRF